MNIFNGTENTRAADSFYDYIKRATLVFINHLMLGGSYRVNEEDKKQVQTALEIINYIIDKYQKE